MVRRHNGQARLWDKAQGLVVVQSLPAMGFPITNLKPEEIEEAFRLFG